MIEVKENVFWNEGSNEQTEDAVKWYAAEVAPKLTAEAAERDAYRRPVKWEVEVETWRATVVRKYINENSPSWARMRDEVKVEKKGGEA